MYISKKEMLCYSLLALFTLVWCGAFSLLGMDIHHDGIMFKTAADVASGKWLFSESFCQYGILTPLLQGAILKITGIELAALKLLTVCFYAAIAVLNDLLWRRFLTVPFRIFSGVMFFILAPYLLVPFHIWSSVYALFCMMLAAETMLSGIERRKHILFFWSGVAAMLAFGFRWPCGVVTLTAEIIALVMWRLCDENGMAFRRNLAWLFGGAAAVTACFALYLTCAGAWYDYWRQTLSFVGGFAWERGGAGSLRSLIGTFLPHDDTMNFIFSFIPLSALGTFFFYCRKIFSDPRSMRKDLPLAVLLLFGLAGYHQYYPVPCVRHLYWGSVLMFGAYAFLLQLIFFNVKFDRRKKILCISLLLLPLIWSSIWRLYGGLFRVSEFFTRQTVELSGVRYIRHGSGERYICQFAQQLRSNLPEVLKKRGVFNYTGDGLWSVILPECRDFRHPMFVNWQRQVYRGYPEAAFEYIDRVRPVVLASSAFFHPAYVKITEFQYMGVVYSLYLPRG